MGRPSVSEPARPLALSFVCLLEIHLDLPEGSSLKGKRQQLLSLKAQLQRRFGVAVAETDHHDLWQRATISCALVGRDASVLTHAAANVVRYVEGRFPDGVRVERGLASREELLG